MLYDTKNVSEKDGVWSEFILVNSINLTVKRIEAYHRNLDEIPVGYTCLLEFEGDTSFILPGQVIGNNSTKVDHDKYINKIRERDNN